MSKEKVISIRQDFHKILDTYKLSELDRTTLKVIADTLVEQVHLASTPTPSGEDGWINTINGGCVNHRTYFVEIVGEDGNDIPSWDIASYYEGEFYPYGVDEDVANPIVPRPPRYKACLPDPSPTEPRTEVLSYKGLIEWLSKEQEKDESFLLGESPIGHDTRLFLSDIQEYFDSKLTPTPSGERKDNKTCVWVWHNKIDGTVSPGFKTECGQSVLFVDEIDVEDFHFCHICSWQVELKSRPPLPPTQPKPITAGDVDWENDSTITLKGHYWCKQEKCNVIWSGESFVYEDKSEHVSSDYFDYYGPLEKI